MRETLDNSAHPLRSKDTALGRQFSSSWTFNGVPASVIPKLCMYIMLTGWSCKLSRVESVVVGRLMSGITICSRRAAYFSASMPSFAACIDKKYNYYFLFLFLFEIFIIYSFKTEIKFSLIHSSSRSHFCSFLCLLFIT